MPKVKGVQLTKKEYEAFVQYLNNVRAESFTRTDVEKFLEWYADNPSFRKSVRPVTKRTSSAHVKKAPKKRQKTVTEIMLKHKARIERSTPEQNASYAQRQVRRLRRLLDSGR